ncbi:MAG: hypothetical protein LBP26_03140 [Clostridiales bacterium]|nr:hypothetical protein [Clostridiales bacterium]
MSINSENARWFRDMESVLSVKIGGAGGVMAAKENDGRVCVSVACENPRKAKISAAVRECVTQMYLTSAKYDYMSGILRLPALSRESYKILLHALVAFDRDAERDIIERLLKITDNLALDGFFNFRLAELRSRWNDIAELAVNNAAYLSSDETLDELLKFLMSAISPKIMRLDVFLRGGCYSVKGRYMDGEFEYRVFNAEQLMLYLINIAPLELNLFGGFKDDRLFKRLTGIFDAKTSENIR